MDDGPSTRASLVLRLRDPRDERAWAEFVEVYAPLIRRLARQSGLQDADAADLAQEVFRSVAASVARFDPDPARGSFRGWLSRIARNLTINFLESRGRQAQATGDSAMRRRFDEHPAAPAPDPDASARFDAEYRRRVFDWALGRVRGEFTEVAWRAFWMTGVEGRGGREVAEALGTTVGTVYYHKSRIMARLRQTVEQFEGGD